MDKDVFLPLDIGNGPGHAEYLVMCSGRESKFVHGLLQQVLSLPVQLAEFADLPGAHLGIEMNGRMMKPRSLPVPGTGNLQTHLGTRGSDGLGRQVPVLYCRYLDMNVDAIQRGVGNAYPIPMQYKRTFFG